VDALLPIFVAVLLSELGGKSQGLSLAYGLAGNGEQGLMALAASAAFLLFFGAFLGDYVGQSIPLEARHLMFAIALLFSGIHMLFKVKPAPDLPPGVGMTRSVFEFAKVRFGEDAQFLAFGLAAKTGQPIIAALGALVAVILAGCAPVIAGKGWPEGVIRWVRIGAGVIFAVIGFILAISAMNLINRD
jgi:Ca2+/H+ antiporter, TMEM165/GDT1 family